MIERYGGVVANAIGALSVAELFWSEHGTGNALEPKGLPKEALDNVSAKALSTVRTLCGLMQWESIEPQIVRLERRLQYAPTKENSREFRVLQDRVRDELRTEFFFHVAPQDVPLYGHAHLFGPAVSAKFDLAREDIQSAGDCLALGQSTACVFHLMRVMELGLRALAQKLKVTGIDPRIETWNKIADHINKAVDKLPRKSVAQAKRKADLGAASAHLNSVRIAWRNEVMHPKQTYTREQAQEVFAATRGFMVHLAGLV